MSRLGHAGVGEATVSVAVMGTGMGRLIGSMGIV